MKDYLVKGLLTLGIALIISGICAGAKAVIDVAILEERVENFKLILLEVRKDTQWMRQNWNKRKDNR